MYFCYWAVDIDNGRVENFMSNTFHKIGDIVELSGRVLKITDYAVEWER